MEIVPALKPFAGFAAVILLVAGAGPGGIRLERAWAHGAPLVGLGLAAVISGALLTPLLLPLVRGRAFSVKGAIVGLSVTLAYAALVLGEDRHDPLVLAFTYVFFPTVSSFLALMFTGSTPFTGVSGVRRELRYAVPVQIAAAAVSLALLVARELRYFAGVTSLHLDRERCTGCGRCVEVCPHGVFAITGRIAEVVDRDVCMECGACARNCAREAISVTAGVGCAMLLMQARAGDGTIGAAERR
jgi:ferredoxin